MGASGEILRSWHAPRKVVRSLLAAPRREGRVLSFLIIGCLLIFVAQGPRLMREVMATADPEAQNLLMRMTYEMFAWLILWPLVFYGIAALIHGVLRLMGGRGLAYDTRLALFWAVLAAAPGALLYGLVMGLIGPGAQAAITGAIWVGGFIWIAASGLFEAGWGQDAELG